MAATTAILLGASGSVGQALLAEIAACGRFDRIVVMARRPLDLPSDSRIACRLVPDMQPESLTQAVIEALNEDQAQAAGFSVLGVGADTAKLTLQQHRAVDVDLNAAFARGLKASGKVQHLAFMSAIGANAHARATGSGAAGMPRYNRVKGEAEDAVRSQGPKVVSIFQPSVIVGSRHTPRALSAVMSLIAPLTPTNYRPARVQDIARAMVAITLQRPSVSAIYRWAEIQSLSAA